VLEVLRSLAPTDGEKVAMLTVVNTACFKRSYVCYTGGSWTILNLGLPPGTHVYPTKYLFMMMWYCPRCHYCRITRP